MRSTLPVCLALLVVIAMGMAFTPVAEAHRTWTVIAGGGVKDTSVVSNSFRPRTIEVAVGDTVTWVFQQPWTLHTVTFLSGQKPPGFEVVEGDKHYINPLIFFPAGEKTYDGTGYLNSGVPPQDPRNRPTYSLTFTKAGTYEYLCMLHGPDMGGRVIVRDRVARSTASVRAQGRREYAATLRSGEAEFARWKPERQGKQVTLPMLGDPKGGWSFLRFSQRALVIERGTTVTWTVPDPMEVHTVTFTSGQKPPDFIVVEPQKQGPPKILENPKAITPTKTKTYDGTGFVNSGIIFPTGSGNPPTSYSLTFTRPGRYDYVCVIHLPWGMKGTVIVK